MTLGGPRCTAYVELDNASLECEKPLHHTDEHAVTVRLWTVAERPRGGKPRSLRDVRLRWR